MFCYIYIDYHIGISYITNETEIFPMIEVSYVIGDNNMDQRKCRNGRCLSSHYRMAEKLFFDNHYLDHILSAAACEIISAKNLFII